MVETAEAVELSDYWGVCPVLQAGRIATTLAVSRDVTGRKAASAAAEALQYALDAKSTTAKE